MAHSAPPPLPYHLTSFEQHKQFSGLFVHEQALFCVYACASVRWSRECGLGLVSGSRQHMPDVALWGPAFIPRCFHSPTFARCTKNVFSSLCIPAKKKRKKVLAFTFCTHLDCGLSFDTQHFSIMQHDPKKICTISLSAPNRFWHTGQANKL